MYICINMAIGDPACVCVRVCVCSCVSGQARREEPRQIDSQRERTASRLSQGLSSGGLKQNPQGGWVELNTYPREHWHPAGEKGSLPCPADCLFLPHLMHTQCTNTPRGLGLRRPQ